MKVEENESRVLVERLEQEYRSSQRTLLLVLTAAIAGVPLVSHAVEGLKTFEPNERIFAKDINDNFSALAAAIDSLESGIDADQHPPVGTVIAFAGRVTTMPPGWLLCDGRGLSKLDYPALWAAIDTSWGDGSQRCSGTCDFNLPDLRGRFMRGVDMGAGIDPNAATRQAASVGGSSGDVVGSIQATSLPSHHHDIPNTALHNAAYCRIPADFGYAMSSGCTPESFATGDASGASGEARPPNANVHYLIKY